MAVKEQAMHAILREKPGVLPLPRQQKSQDCEDYHLYDQLRKFRRVGGILHEFYPILMDNLQYCWDSRMSEDETTGYITIVEKQMREEYEKRYGMYRDGRHDCWMEDLKKLYNPYFHIPHNRDRAEDMGRDRGYIS